MEEHFFVQTIAANIKGISDFTIVSQNSVIDFDNCDHVEN